jgi:hypothetical protein
MTEARMDSEKCHRIDDALFLGIVDAEWLKRDAGALYTTRDVQVGAVGEAQRPYLHVECHPQGFPFRSRSTKTIIRGPLRSGSGLLVIPSGS